MLWQILIRLLWVKKIEVNYIKRSPVLILSVFDTLPRLTNKLSSHHFISLWYLSILTWGNFSHFYFSDWLSSILARWTNDLTPWTRMLLGIQLVYLKDVMCSVHIIIRDWNSNSNKKLMTIKCSYKGCSSN